MKNYIQFLFFNIFPGHIFNMSWKYFENKNCNYGCFASSLEILWYPRMRKSQRLNQGNYGTSMVQNCWSIDIKAEAGNNGKNNTNDKPKPNEWLLSLNVAHYSLTLLTLKIVSTYVCTNERCVGLSTELTASWPLPDRI